MAHHIEPDSVTTFMHQMIPHHQNAVNMARVLLKKTPSGYVGGDGSLKVSIAETEAGEHDGFQDILLDMINTQNYQISEMRKWLLENSKRVNSTCGRRLSPEDAPGVPPGLKRLQATNRESASQPRKLKAAQSMPSSSARKLGSHSATLKFSMDLFTSSTGYYKVEGYDGVQPTLTIDLNKEYWLDQSHITNWMHPIGLAYQPDGAHDVLYPGTGGEGAPEVADGAGTAGYEYVYEIKYPGTTAFVAKTLDDYEPLFFYPLKEWAKYEFRIKFKVTDASFAKNIVYFCHIHNKMSGKILINGGTGTKEVSNLYNPHVQSSTFDAGCGTYGASPYQDACAGQRFLCGDTSTNFAKCLIAV